MPHYASSETALPLPAGRHGSGLISLQRVLLLLQLARRRAADGQNFLMALEEPELHVPPPLQRRLVSRLQALSSQTFVSTHSPMVAALADPRTVSVLRNDGGVLSAVPLLKKPLAAATVHSVRKLFQIHRRETIAAIMHDVVLVPEGLIDKEWLDLLLRSVDANQGWHEDKECHFGSYVGVVPTQDAAVIPTFETLRPLHHRIVVLVDGDTAGLGYAAKIAGCASFPEVVFRWPDGWTIEDVIGWILSGDAPAAVTALAATIQPAPATVEDLVKRLKSGDRSIDGLKQDRLASATIADIIATFSGCVDRARSMLNAISDVALGQESSLFTTDKTGASAVAIFSP